MADENPPEAPAPAPPKPAAPSAVGRIVRVGLFVLFAVASTGGVVGYLWWRKSLGVSTDDAFLRADVVQVPADVGGKVVEVHVIENQHVHKDDILMKIDDADYQLRLVAAQANLAAAEDDADRADKAAAMARSDAKKGQVRLADAKREQGLQQTLAAGGAGVQAVVDRATTATAMAAQDVTTSRVGITIAEGAADAAHARVDAAKAAVALAQRDVDMSVIRAPSDGVASKVDLQVGEMVQRGQAVLAVVPDVRYVVANFKETDIDRIHVGDDVDIDVDAFPDAPLVGKVESLGAGTGAIFALIPADNASGNFIKVVQRVPVRIAIDDPKASTYPAGLSTNVLVKSHP